MRSMFDNAKSFNQELNNWNVSAVLNMEKMFKNAVNFNQNISNWNINHLAITHNIFKNTAIKFYKLKNNSIYDKTFFHFTYAYLSSLEKKQIFDKLFDWDRRKNFIMFLSYYNYNCNKIKNFII